MNINNPIFYAIVMIFAGSGIPIMAAMNAGVGAKIQNPAVATTILIIVAFLMSILILSFSSNEVNLSLSKLVPMHYFLAGGLFVFYISTISWIAPKFGFANAITFIFIGQMISMCAIDHFGLFNAAQYSFNWQRLFGLLMMIIGIFIVVKKA